MANTESAACEGLDFVIEKLYETLAWPRITLGIVLFFETIHQEWTGPYSKQVKHFDATLIIVSFIPGSDFRYKHEHISRCSAKFISSIQYSLGSVYWPDSVYITY